MKTALILTDFSEAATHAAEYLVHNATNLGLEKVIVLNMVPPVSSIPKSPMIVRDQEDEIIDSRRILKDYGARLREQLNKQIEFETHVREMLIGEELNDVVKDWGVNVVVMGMAGKSKAEQTLIGSNTVRVLKLSDVPVLIVPNDSLLKSIEKIIYTVNLEGQKPFIPKALLEDILVHTRAELTWLSVGKGHRKDAAEINEGLTLDGHPQARSEVAYVEDDNVVKGILAYAKDHGSSLIVSSPRERGFFEEIFHASVTRKLAYSSKVPLLLVKEKH